MRNKQIVSICLILLICIFIFASFCTQYTASAVTTNEVPTRTFDLCKKLCISNPNIYIPEKNKIEGSDTGFVVLDSNFAVKNSNIVENHTINYSEYSTFDCGRVSEVVTNVPDSDTAYYYLECFPQVASKRYTGNQIDRSMLLNNYFESRIQSNNIYEFLDNGDLIEYWSKVLDYSADDLEYSCTYKYDLKGDILTIYWDGYSGQSKTELKYVHKEKATYYINYNFDISPNNDYLFYETDWVDSGGPSDQPRYFSIGKNKSEFVQESKDTISEKDAISFAINYFKNKYVYNEEVKGTATKKTLNNEKYYYVIVKTKIDSHWSAQAYIYISIDGKKIFEEGDVTEIIASVADKIGGVKAVDIENGVRAIAAAGGIDIAVIRRALPVAKIVDKDGNEVSDNAPLSTGMKLMLYGQSVPIVVLGDVDGNGEINVADARLALRQAVSLENLNGVYLFAGKVGGDSVGVSEARKILRAAVGLDDSKDWLK